MRLNDVQRPTAFQRLLLPSAFANLMQCGTASFDFYSHFKLGLLLSSWHAYFSTSLLCFLFATNDFFYPTNLLFYLQKKACFFGEKKPCKCVSHQVTKVQKLLSMVLYQFHTIFKGCSTFLWTVSVKLILWAVSSTEICGTLLASSVSQKLTLAPYRAPLQPTRHTSQQLVDFLPNVWCKLGNILITFILQSTVTTVDPWSSQLKGMSSFHLETVVLWLYTLSLFSALSCFKTSFISHTDTSYHALSCMPEHTKWPRASISIASKRNSTSWVIFPLLADHSQRF